MQQRSSSQPDSHGIPDTTSSNGNLFIRQRNHAVSVRLRRRKGLSTTNVDSAGKQTPRSSAKNQASHTVNHLGLSPDDFEDNWTLKMAAEKRLRHRPRAYSDEWDPDSEEEDEFMMERNQRGRPERKSLSGLCRNPRLLKCSPMETLDRRISVSTEQLDTLKRDKQRAQEPGTGNASRPRGNRGILKNGQSRARSATRPDNADGLRKQHQVTLHNNEQQSDDKNNNSDSSRGRSDCANGGKTAKWLLKGSRNKSAKDMFLLEEGPYSRRLYGPPSPEELMATPTSQIDEERRRRTRSHEILLHEVGIIIVIIIIIRVMHLMGFYKFASF